jgi:hypothetical protein
LPDAASCPPPRFSPPLLADIFRRRRRLIIIYFAATISPFPLTLIGRFIVAAIAISLFFATLRFIRRCRHDDAAFLRC